MTEERIVAVAIDYDGLVLSIAAPARHSDVLNRAIQLFEYDLTARLSHLNRQGFVTSHGRFVDRSAAAVIAKAANQILGDGKMICSTLTSEDLW